MKRYLFILLFFAATFSANSQQNWYTYNYSADTLAQAVVHYIEVPATFVSLWTLGGSFSVKNLGGGNANWSVTVQGTSDESLASNSTTGWQDIKVVQGILQAAGTTTYNHFRAANEMFYLGHTRLRLSIFSSLRPIQINSFLVLKKA